MSFAPSALGLGLLLTSAVVVAATPPAGATSCSGCHAKGVAAPPLLTERPVDDIVNAMAEFRDGKRPATVMDRIARGFSDAETRDIATWLVARR
ncbi:MAG: cytochrome C [Steroidobacteraceae bacterium]